MVAPAAPVTALTVNVKAAPELKDAEGVNVAVLVAELSATVPAIGFLAESASAMFVVLMLLALTDPLKVTWMAVA
jgi:hypothetical protein